MNDITVTLRSEIFGEGVDVDIDDPWVVNHLRRRQCETELEQIQESFECGNFDGSDFKEERAEARATMSELRREIKEFLRDEKQMRRLPK